MARLYVGALSLGEGDLSEVGECSTERSHEEEQTLRNRLSVLPFQYYWELGVSARDLAGEPRAGLGDLFDDVMDMYFDLREGLAHFDRGNVAGAVGHWSVHFRCHWGDHVLAALRPLHDYLSGRVVGPTPRAHRDENEEQTD